MSEDAVKKYETLDDIFGNISSPPSDDGTTKVENLLMEQLYDFPNHPFKVKEDAAMQEMVASIRENGVLNPVLARPRKNGGYEIISGHRRRLASQLAGIKQIPAIVREYSDDAAIILMVDSNLQRENILPSEKAFSYKMKLDALNRQGQKITSAQVEQKLSRDIVGKSMGESGQQVQRYIRLTNLIPPLLDMVDEKQIAFSPAVELSFLKEAEQHFLLHTIETEEATPSLSQAQRLKQLSQQGKLGEDAIFAVMTEEKPNQVSKFKIERSRIEKFIPKEATEREVQDIIYKALESWHKKQQRQREDAR